MDKELSKIMVLGFLLMLIVNLDWVEAKEKNSTKKEFGGPQIMWFMPDMSDLDNEIEKISFPIFGKSAIFAYGGGGFGYDKEEKWRFGGFGARGRQEKSHADKTSELVTEFGGVTVEYCIPKDKWTFTFGGILGGGWIDVHFSATQELTRFDGMHWLFGTLAGAEYQFTPKFSLGLNTDYLFWKVHGDWTGTHENVPQSSSMDISGPIIRLNAIFIE
jgi:hypothetical protein